MLNTIKSKINSTSVGNSILKLYRHIKLKYYYTLVKSDKDLFTSYYKINNWGSEESISGPGSTLEFTENIQKEIPQLINKYNIKSVLDIPCGDYNWFQFINDQVNIHYTGADIVDELIEFNSKNYSDAKTKFINLNLIKEKLLQADLIICRDCMVHFSNKDIFTALDNIKSSSAKYVLLTSYTESKINTDIPTGAHRELNLELPPFKLIKPMYYIDDWIEGTSVKKLGLWKTEQLK